MSEDPKSIAEFVAEPSEVTQERMRQRQEDREEAERLVSRGGSAPPPVSGYSPFGASVTYGEAMLVQWWRDGAKLHPRELMGEILEELQRLGWRPPPTKDESGYIPDWKWRQSHTSRLSPERVQANAQRVREVLHAKQRTDVPGSTNPVGGDAGTQDAEVSAAS